MSTENKHAEEAVEKFFGWLGMYTYYPPPRTYQQKKQLAEIITAAVEAYSAEQAKSSEARVDALNDFLETLGSPKFSAKHPCHRAIECMTALKEQLAAKDAEIAELKRKMDDLIPSECPITKEPYFMLIQDERGIWRPTFGGPYDSYTIPVRDGEDLDRRRYDHDEGAWKEGCESINLKVIEEDKLVELQCNSEELTALARQVERLRGLPEKWRAKAEHLRLCYNRESIAMEAITLDRCAGALDAALARQEEND